MLENTCLAADLLLRLPDEMAAYLQVNSKWDLVLRWAITFSLQTGYLEENSVKLLDLASQEIGLSSKRPDYVNPYKKVKKPAKRFEDPPPEKKKERKKIQRGPKMSRSDF